MGVKRLVTDKAAFTGEHHDGRSLTSLDHKTGMLGLDTHEGRLTVHFPPSAIEHSEKGDRVSVEPGISAGDSPAASPSTGSTESAPGRKRSK